MERKDVILSALINSLLQGGAERTARVPIGLIVSQSEEPAL